MQSLAHQFLEFCRSKPADEEYDYWDTRNCAVQQFVQQGLGYEADSVRAYGHVAHASRHLAIPQPWTFGALATRLASALTEQAS